MGTTSGRPATANPFGAVPVRPQLLHPVIAWTVALAVFVIGHGVPTWGLLSTRLGPGVEATAEAPSESDRTAWNAILPLLQLAALVIGVTVVGVYVPRFKHREVYGSPVPLRAIAARPRGLAAVLIPVVIAIIPISFATGMSLAGDGVIGDYTPRGSRQDGSLGLDVWNLVYSVWPGQVRRSVSCSSLSCGSAHRAIAGRRSTSPASRCAWPSTSTTTSRSSPASRSGSP